MDILDFQGRNSSCKFHVACGQPWLQLRSSLLAPLNITLGESDEFTWLGHLQIAAPKRFFEKMIWDGEVERTILMVVFVYQIRPMSCDFTMWIVFASRFRNKQILGAAGNLAYRSGRDGEHEAILFRSQTPVIFDKSKASYVGIFPHDPAAVACNRYCLI